MEHVKKFKRALMVTACFVMIIAGTLLTVRGGTSTLKRRSFSSPNSDNDNSSLGATMVPPHGLGFTHGSTLPDESRLATISARNDSRNSSGTQNVTRIPTITTVHTTTLATSLYAKATSLNATVATEPTVASLAVTASTITQVNSSVMDTITVTTSRLTTVSSHTSAETTSKDGTASENPPTNFSHNATVNGTLSDTSPELKQLSPVLMAVVGVVSALAFFAIVFAIAKLVKNFKSFRFRRLQEVPMDDFDDYSGVYVEHTVPFRG